MPSAPELQAHLGQHAGDLRHRDRPRASDHRPLASTVVDCTGERPVVRRPGAIPVAEIARVLAEVGLELGS